MLVLKDKRVVDCITTLSSLNPTLATPAKIDIFTATYPCYLRIKCLGWAGRSSTSAATDQVIGAALVIVPNGLQASSLAAFPASGNGVDWYEPCHKIVWQRMFMWMDSNAGTGPGGSDGNYYGNGDLIQLGTGDSIWWTTSSIDNNGCVLYLTTHIDIMR